MNNTEIAPCPFCGGAMTKHEGILGLTFEHDLDDCPLAGFELHIHAFAAWNRRAASPVEPSKPLHTPGPWFIRKRTDREGNLLDCFVAAKDVNGFAYDAEILGDDEYRDGIERKLADCELVVRAVNAALASPVAPAVQEPTSLDEAISSIRYTTELMPGKVPPAPSAAPAGSHWQHRRPGEQWQDGLPSVQVQHDFEFRQVSLPAAPGAASPDKGMKS
jgi:hypothetical protein